MLGFHANTATKQKIVITSEARDLLSFRVTQKQIPRFARDDNLLIRACIGLVLLHWITTGGLDWAAVWPLATGH